MGQDVLTKAIRGTHDTRIRSVGFEHRLYEKYDGRLNHSRMLCEVGGANYEDGEDECVVRLL